MSKKIWILPVLLCLLAMVNCAKRGSVGGGEIDEIPPQFIKASPPNQTTNFSAKEIRIYFDEYVKLQDPQKHIIISPPMDPKPTITPLGGANKYIKIKILDTLLENTTYSINFGQSIVDNNEGNSFPFFSYVFSTGDFLDSLQIKGTIKDAIVKQLDPFITVALYEVDESYTDSLVYNELPRYITSTQDSIRFEFNNLKEGDYKLIALKDAASNYKFDPRQDKIGFYERHVTLPADTSTVFNLNLFKEVLPYKVIKPKQISKNHFIFGYEGVADSMQIRLLTSDIPPEFKYRIFKDTQHDSLQYWFTPFFEKDTLRFEVKNTDQNIDTLITRFKDQYKDSLVIRSNTKSTLAPNEAFSISANTPLAKVNTEKITLVDKDTLPVPFTVALDTLQNKATFQFESSEDNRYSFQLLPESITDFIANVNDTIDFTIRTQKLADYGKMFLTLEGIQNFPVLVQLTNEKGEKVSEKSATKNEELTFEYLVPNQYNVRIVFDANKNGKWDTGDFLKELQPEKVQYLGTSIDVRANWEVKQTFTVKDE